MRPTTVVWVALLLGLAPEARAGIFADVPFTHWAYQCSAKMQLVGPPAELVDDRYRGMQPMTRYEFAVFVVRFDGWVRPLADQPGAMAAWLACRETTEARMNEVARKLDASPPPPVARHNLPASAAPVLLRSKLLPPSPPILLGGNSLNWHRRNPALKLVTVAQRAAAMDAAAAAWQRLIAEFRAELRQLGVEAASQEACALALRLRVAAVTRRPTAGRDTISAAPLSTGGHAGK